MGTEKKSTVLSIRMGLQARAALEAEAKRRGVPAATLARDLLVSRAVGTPENAVKAPAPPVSLQNTLPVYHIDDLKDDELRHHTPSLAK